MERAISNKDIETITVYVPERNSTNNSGIAAALIDIVKKLFG